VCFERADGSFCFFATVHVWWDKLEFAFVGVLDDKFVVLANFVVQDLLCDKYFAGFETSHDFLYAGIQ
jgi:hypothetical protein